MAHVQLDWQDNSNNEFGFSIERSTDGVNFSEIDTVGANIEEYLDITAEEGTTYFYRVKSYSIDGYSDPSNIVEITTTEPPQLHWDTFTDTNGTQLTAHSPEIGNGYSSFLSGAGITIQLGTVASVSSSVVRAVITDINRVHSYRLNSSVYIGTTGAGVEAGFIFACSAGGGANYYTAQWYGDISLLAIFRFGHGGTTILNTASATWPINTFFPIELVVTPTNLTFTFNGHILATAWTPPASTFDAVGIYGRIPSTSLYFNHFEVTEL